MIDWTGPVQRRHRRDGRRTRRRRGPFLEGEGIPVHGILPRDRSLAGVTVADLARNLGADILTGDANTDVHVERFSVGAMSGSSALERFRRTRDAVVVTGGDRSEVQTAALEASGINALLLTGGYQPASAVIGRRLRKTTSALTVRRADDARQSRGSAPTRAVDEAHSDRHADPGRRRRRREELFDGLTPVHRRFVVGVGV